MRNVEKVKEVYFPFHPIMRQTDWRPGRCAEPGATAWPGRDAHGPRDELSSVLDCVHLAKLVVQDGVVTLELEVAVELLLLKQEGKPVAVIGPHVSEGDLVQLEPLGAHF